MAPFSFVTATVSCMARSFTSCSSYLTRCSCVLPPTYISTVKYLSSLPSGRPKRPLNGYVRYVVQQLPAVSKEFPDARSVDLIKMIAQQWRTLGREKKQPFEEAFQRDLEQFKVDLQHYKEQLTPAQLQQQSAETRQKVAERKARRKKRELTSFGKPKRPRTPFNIYMSEHFAEARGSSITGKMIALSEDWRNLLDQQKELYKQLAEDDKVRYMNEMKPWEEHMLEIGREDLIREKTLPKKKKTLEMNTKKNKDSESVNQEDDKFKDSFS